MKHYFLLVVLCMMSIFLKAQKMDKDTCYSYYSVIEGNFIFTQVEIVAKTKTKITKESCVIDTVNLIKFKQQTSKPVIDRAAHSYKELIQNKALLNRQFEDDVVFRERFGITILDTTGLYNFIQKDYSNNDVCYKFSPTKKGVQLQDDKGNSYEACYTRSLIRIYKFQNEPYLDFTVINQKEGQIIWACLKSQYNLKTE